MIDRYTTPEMAKIWSDENKYETWKKVEITVTEVLSDRGEVPKEAVKVIFYVELVILFGWWIKLILIADWQDWS